MKKLFFLFAAVMGLLLVGCTTNTGVAEGGDLNGILTVTIQGDNNGNAQQTPRAIGEPTQQLENAVKAFTVYVFNNANGVLEKSADFTDALTGTIPGLSTAFTKRVVVLVNKPSTYPNITNYSDFALAANMIGLDTQLPADLSTKGLFMSGEVGSVTITAGMNLTVPVRRIVSKVKLGSLTVTPDEGLSLDNFVISGVSMQKVRDYSPVLGGLATTGFKYVGGLTGSVSSVGDTPKPYLMDAYELPAGYTPGTKLTPNAYFYVFPNDNADNIATMMTISGSYNGSPMYFTFYVNDKAGNNGGDTTDATYITRNKVYVIHVLLKKIGTGANDPDLPNEQVSIDVTVNVEDWESTLEQHVEW